LEVEEQEWMSELTVLVENEDIATVEVDSVSGAETGDWSRRSVSRLGLSHGNGWILTAAANNNNTRRGHVGVEMRMSEYEGERRCLEELDKSRCRMKGES